MIPHLSFRKTMVLNLKNFLLGDPPKSPVEPRWAKQQMKKLRPQPTKQIALSRAIIESDARPTGYN